MPATGMQVFWTDVEVIVDSSSLFRPGHAVNNWAVKVVTYMATKAGQYAPPNRSAARWPRQSTGALRSSIRGEVYRTTSNTLSMALSAHAPYLSYVHEGTAYQGYRYIYSTEGWLHKAEIDARFNRAFRVPRNTAGQFEPRGEQGWNMAVQAGAGFPAAPLLRVHGQRANPFLTDAYVATARRHSSLPKKRFRRTLLTG